jgi:hypothetical protein
MAQGPQEKRAEALKKAAEELGESCIMYPPPDSPEREAFFEAYPGTIWSVYQQVVKLAELAREEEGKG